MALPSLNIARDLLDAACSKGLFRLVMPIALYRPQIGPSARNGEKGVKKSILAPPEKRGNNGRNMGKLPHFGASFPIFWPFFPHFPGGAKIHFSAIFSPFRAGGPIWGQNRAIGIASLGIKKESVKNWGGWWVVI